MAGCCGKAGAAGITPASPPYRVAFANGGFKSYVTLKSAEAAAASYGGDIFVLAAEEDGPTSYIPVDGDPLAVEAAGVDEIAAEAAAAEAAAAEEAAFAAELAAEEAAANANKAG